MHEKFVNEKWFFEKIIKVVWMSSVKWETKPQKSVMCGFCEIFFCNRFFGTLAVVLVYFCDVN